MNSLLRRVLLLVAASVFTAASALATTANPVKPGISKEPVPSLSVAVGSSAAFSVTANGTATLKYQWKLGNGNITGATKSSYTIAKVTPSNAGNYSVIVSNAAGSIRSSGTQLTVTPNFAGKYNIAVLEYNATDVMNGHSVQNGQSSGGALYGSETVKGSGTFYTFTTTLLGYLGSDVTGASNTTTGNITGGVINIKSSGNDFTFTVVKGSDGVTPIGFIGKGTPSKGSDNTNDGFIIGLNATTTAPKSAAACAGNYTVIIISYNATAVSKMNVAENDGDAAIGKAVVTTGGAFTVTQYRYAAGGGNDTLGQSQVITGQVSSSGAVSSVLVQTGQGPVTHPISLKFVTLNGQVIGFTGTFKPISGQDDSGILIGISGIYTPLGPSFF